MTISPDWDESLESKGNAYQEGGEAASPSKEEKKSKPRWELAKNFIKRFNEENAKLPYEEQFFIELTERMLVDAIDQKNTTHFANERVVRNLTIDGLRETLFKQLEDKMEAKSIRIDLQREDRLEREKRALEKAQEKRELEDKTD